MIRREVRHANGSQRWALISQIDHAQLAAQLAEHWGANGFLPLEPRPALLWAILHHDDGWADWELSPGVLAGRPRSFLEMDLCDSLPIWSGSIEVAADHGPLPAYVVAGHFCALLRRASAHSRGDREAADAAQFLAANAERLPAWLATWRAEDPLRNTPELAQQALAQLQFFDLLSLWFCCHEAVEPDRLTAPGPRVLNLIPQGPESVALDPWPLTCPRLRLEVGGGSVPVGFYDSAAALATAASESVRLHWEIGPASG